VSRFLPAFPLPDDEIAVILTHSYEQDRALLAALLPRDLRYLGILGPRHRTARLLNEVTPLIDLSVAEAFERLHSPIGLDLGAGDPSSVALSIVAEIQAVLHGRRVQVMRLKPVSGERPTQDPPFEEPVNAEQSLDEFPVESAVLPADQRA
jgi:xanthine/CO dehydrogenase XdhC/CoxF family maturation factor